MGRTKQYRGDIAAFEKKLARVMERLGVEHYQYDWMQQRGGSSCYVEMRYGASTYRFENSADKSAECGRNLTYVSDLFGEIVYSLEGLARAVEKGIFTLDMLLVGVPALPAAKPLAPCFAALGFTKQPENAEEIKKQYHKMLLQQHPDTGSGELDIVQLRENYLKAMEIMKAE